MHMKRNTFLTIYGSLIFQKQSNKWIVQPFWMGHSLKEIQDYFHNEQIGYKILGSFLAIAGILVIGNFFVIPIFSYFERERKKYRQIGKDELSHFKKLNHLEADPREKLNCMKCKNNTVEIAYECGHLVVCDKCWKQLKEARNLSCPICNKDSKKFLKLYLA